MISSLYLFYHVGSILKASLSSNLKVAVAVSSGGSGPSDKGGPGHPDLEFLKVLCFSFPVPVVDPFAFAAENIKNLPIALHAREKI